MKENKYNGNYDDFLEKLASVESGKTSYKTKSKFGYLGKYQMGEYALVDVGFYYESNNDYKNIDWKGGWTKKAKEYNINSVNDFLNTPKAQEVAIRLYHNKIIEYIKHYNIDRFIGSKYNDIEITLSGLLAACHLVGITTIKNFNFSNNNISPADRNGTKAEKYLKLFENYDISIIEVDRK